MNFCLLGYLNTFIDIYSLFGCLGIRILMYSYYIFRQVCLLGLLLIFLAFLAV